MVAAVVLIVFIVREPGIGLNPSISGITCGAPGTAITQQSTTAMRTILYVRILIFLLISSHILLLSDSSRNFGRAVVRP